MSDEELAVEEQEGLAPEEGELSEEEQAMAKLKEAITVEKLDIGPLRLKLTITIPEDTLNEKRGEQFAELKRDSVVPGFRKGRAPMALVEKRFASDVGEQLKNQVVTSAYLAAVEKEDLKPLGDPLFWSKVTEERIDNDGKPRQVESEKLLAIDKALEVFVVPKQGPLTYSCEIELKPQFDLPKLDAIPIEKPAVTISKDDVNQELERMRMMRGRFEPVEKGTVQADDMLIGDMKLSVEGEVISTEENFDVAARDIRVKGITMKGFGDAAVGKKLDATISLEAVVPADHENIDIREKTATFEFSIKEVKRLVLPALDKEFLEGIGFDSENQLRDAVETTLESHLAESIKEGMRRQIGDYLLEATKLEIPEGLSQRQAERSVARRMIELYQQGIPEAEIEKRLDELRSRAHDQTIRDLKLFFILEKIAEDREVTVGEEQLNTAIAQIARQSNRRFDRVRDDLSKGEGLTTLYMKLRDQQVLDLLCDEAKVTESKGPKTKKVTESKSRSSAAKKASPEESPVKKQTPDAKKTTGKVKKATGSAKVAKKKSK